MSVDLEACSFAPLRDLQAPRPNEWSKKILLPNAPVSPPRVHEAGVLVLERVTLQMDSTRIYALLA